MFLLCIGILCLFSLYFLWSEYRVYKLTEQRNHWHIKYLDEKDEPPSPDEYEPSCAID